MKIQGPTSSYFFRQKYLFFCLNLQASLSTTVTFGYTETTVGIADTCSKQVSFSNSQGYELLYNVHIRVWTDTLQRHKYQKFETNIPRKELRGLSPNTYIHVSVSYCYIPTIGLPILLQKKVDPSWEYTDHSQTHECGNWDWGRAIPFLGIHKSKFFCSALKPLVQTYQKFFCLWSIENGVLELYLNSIYFFF